MSLIQRQEQAIAEMKESRSSAKRETSHRRSVAARFYLRSTSLGYTPEQAAQQVRDVWDMYHLELAAEGA